MSCDAGPDLKRPDVLKVVDTLGKVFRLLDRLAERERELQLWARAEHDGGKQACTVIAGVLFHSLDIVHASVLVTPQAQRVRIGAHLPPETRCAAEARRRHERRASAGRERVL